MGTRTALFSRKQAGGVFTIADFEQHPNDVWFVDSTNGTDGTGYGYNPDAPVATLDYAVGLAAAGDKIYIAPWHAENLTTALAVNVDVAGITIEGIKMGNLMPTFSMTLLAGSITVAEANVTLKNIKCVANVASGVTTGITLPAAATGCTLDGIVFRDTTADKEFLAHVRVEALVTDLTIKNCSFVGIFGGTCLSSILFAGATTNTVIEDNYFFVDASGPVIDHLTAAAVNCVIRRNVVINGDVTALNYSVRHHANGTGVAYDNYFASNHIDSEISDGAKVWWFQNYASNTIVQSGLLDPTTAHAIP